MAETPNYNDDINTNQPLIIKDKPKQESNPFILPPESKMQNEIHIPYKKDCFNISIIIIFIFMIGTILPGFSFGIYIGLVIFFIPLICLFSFLCHFKKKLIIVKDVKNNSLNIKQQNYLCCSQKYKFSLENSAFVCEKLDDYESGLYTGLNFAIINILKNKNEIDLDSSTIKEVPLKIIHNFYDLNIDENFELKLNNFINSPGYINGEPDEYNKYLYRYQKTRIKFQKKKKIGNF